jgi:cysteinyl-tRNA synthetase
MKLYNTETRQKETLKPLDGKKVRLYTCGPTIYDFAHIGNFRTYVFEDVLRRAIQFFGMKVEQVMNITDLDDKTIKGAIAKGVTLKEFTEPYRVAFFEDLAVLGIEKAEHYPNATDYIPQMIGLIEMLLKNGHAYRNKSIYFSIRKFSKYGRLSHFKMEDLKVNASGENEADEYDKENISDFVLWKAYDSERDGNIYWESPFGKGRPGWHIECSAMATSLLGPSIDIHCGGVDNMFPHHENEIAQSECCTGVQFVHIWLHSDHLVVDGKKMSKSLGNFFTLRQLLQKGYTGQEIRYLLLSHHYRTQLNFTFAGLDGARASIYRIRDLLERLQSVTATGSLTISSLLEAKDREFRAGMADDLNTSVALAALFELLRELNVLFDGGKLSFTDADAALKLLKEWDKVLGLIFIEAKEEVPAAVQALFEKRLLARKEKNYALSDELKLQIGHAGYLVEDTPTGGRLKKK